MKFIANPDKFIFFIGSGIVGSLFIVAYMILNQVWLLILVLVIWLSISCYLAKKNCVVFVVLKNKFLIKSMKKEYEIYFKDVDYIVEYSNHTNFLKEKRYELKISSKINIDDRVLQIENKVFSKWILKQTHNFVIKRQMIYD